MLTPWTCPQCGRAAQVSRFPVRCSCGRSSLADGTSLAQAPRVPAAQIGPGAVLHELLAGWGVTAQAGCGCEDMAARMNAWGVEGCRERVDEIAGWLVAEAVRRDWPLARWRIGGVLMAAAARGLVRRAITRAERAGIAILRPPTTSRNLTQPHGGAGVQNGVHHTDSPSG